MVAGVDRHRVGSDFVGEVPVGGHPVAAQNDQVHLALSHEKTGHVVGDKGAGDVVVHQLIGGEPGSLEQGTGLICVNHIHFTLAESTAHHAEGGAVPAGGQAAGVAVGEDTGVGGDHSRAEVTQSAVHFHILPVDGLSLPDEDVDGLRRVVVGLQAVGHAPQGPEQVDGSGPAGGEHLLRLFHGGGKVRRIAEFQCGQTVGVGGRYADGGGAPYHHVGDGSGHSAEIGVGNPVLPDGKPCLVEEVKCTSFPANSIHSAAS